MSYSAGLETGYAVVLTERVLEAVLKEMKQGKSSKYLNDLYKGLGRKEKQTFDVDELKQQLHQSSSPYDISWAISDGSVDYFDYDIILNSDFEFDGIADSWICLWLGQDNVSPFAPDYISEASMVKHAEDECLFFPKGFDIKNYIVKYKQTNFG